ncbi:hypothetical protein MRB53_021489 [Persea americana]|uniref:Uncharacterized protein n=1 Tax=Persea americana TaxID=3435 RepID=A0ACC2L3V5_PERAE|nr:hypothetical protein MRB53_021489 [Persea americana]
MRKIRSDRRKETTVSCERTVLERLAQVRLESLPPFSSPEDDRRLRLPRNRKKKKKNQQRRNVGCDLGVFFRLGPTTPPRTARRRRSLRRRRRCVSRRNTKKGRLRCCL